RTRTLAPLHLATLHPVFPAIPLRVDTEDAADRAGRGTHRPADDAADRPCGAIAILGTALCAGNRALGFGGGGQGERRQDEGGCDHETLHGNVLRGSMGATPGFHATRPRLRPTSGQREGHTTVSRSLEPSPRRFRQSPRGDPRASRRGWRHRSLPT